MDIWDTVIGTVSVAIPFIDNIPVIRETIGVVLFFFAPGFAWSLVLFRTVGRLERTVLSVGLSIAIITLTIAVASAVFRVSVNGTTSLVIIIILIILPLAIRYGVDRFIGKRSHESE